MATKKDNPKCPTCGTNTIQINNENGVLVSNTYKCPNPECPNTNYIKGES